MSILGLRVPGGVVPNMIASWVGHAAVGFITAALFGVVPASYVVAIYVGREVGQHGVEGTMGTWEWVDRVMDVVSVALGVVGGSLV